MRATIRLSARWAILAGAAVAAPGAPRTPQAQGAPAARSAARVEVDSAIGAGVRWRRIVDPAGPWVINVVAVDRRRCQCEFRHVRANDSLASREKLSAMVARQREGPDRVPAAINADFFNLQTGENENNQVIAGEWWKGTRGSDSPYDAFANVRTHFAIDASGHPLLDRFTLDGAAIRGADVVPVLAVNFLPRGGPETVALFTPRRGATPRDTVRRTAEVALREVGRRGDTAIYVQIGATDTTGGHAIPPGTVRLAAYGPRAATVRRFAAHDTVRIVLRAAADRGDGPYVAPAMLIGGWPRILAGGRSVAARSAWDEGTLSSNAEARHPRSAIGYNRDRSVIYLVTVDGRQTASVGVTLVELAEVMRREGAWDALNFDGGGSTTLVLRGQIVNSPSDAAGEREIGNAVLVVAR